MPKQMDFFKTTRDFAPSRLSYGDESGINKRKIARPFKRNCTTHVVLKSDLAKGPLNLLTPANQLAVDRIYREQAEKFEVKIHALQYVGNHIHSILSCPSKEKFQNFLRAVTGLIARFVLRGKPGKFWTQIPFTRLITGRRDYLSMFNYVAKNMIEATVGKFARKEIDEREAIERREKSRTKRKRILGR